MAKAILLKDGIKLRDKVKELNLTLHNVYAYKSNHSELDYDTILDILSSKEKGKSFAVKCKEAGISDIRAYGIKKRYRDFTDEQVIEYCKRLDSQLSVREACIKYEITNHEGVYKFVAEHSELSVENAVKLYKSEVINRQTIQDLLRKNNVSATAFYHYKKKYKDLSDAEIIDKILKSKEEITQPDFKLINLCKKFNVSYMLAVKYKQRHEELTDEEVIMHYNKNCYINIFGELVTFN